MRRGFRAIAVAVMAVGLAFAWVGPAAAACDGPFPSVRQVASTVRDTAAWTADTSVADESAGADESGGPADPDAFDPWPWIELLLISSGVAFLLLSRRERT